jgi:hypothetical protein
MIECFLVVGQNDFLLSPKTIRVFTQPGSIGDQPTTEPARPFTLNSGPDRRDTGTAATCQKRSISGALAVDAENGVGKSGRGFGLDAAGP